MSNNVRIYCRNSYGVVTDIDNLEEALDAFFSYEGYRISFETPNNYVHIWRDELPMASPNDLTFDPKTRTYEAKIAIFSPEHSVE